MKKGKRFSKKEEESPSAKFRTPSAIKFGGYGRGKNQAVKPSSSYRTQHKG